jgi:hypothetical protein
MLYLQLFLTGDLLLLSKALNVSCDAIVVCSPLEQFEVFSVAFAFITNSAIFLVLPLLFVSGIFYMVYRKTTFI